MTSGRDVGGSVVDRAVVEGDDGVDDDRVIAHGKCGPGVAVTAQYLHRDSDSYCSGWLRPVENHAANIPADTIASFEPALRGLLGAGVHDATSRGGGVLGLVDGTNPTRDRTTR